MALSTSRTLITKTGISTTQVFDMGGINIAGGDFNLGSAIKLGNASGIITATSFSGSFSGNISGTPTLGTGVTITASGMDITGIVTATRIVSTIGTFTGDTAISGSLQIADTIQHEGDVNTKIRFPAADTVTVETSGSEMLRIDSSGRLLTGNISETAVAANGMHIRQSSAGNNLVSLILENHGSTTDTSTELKFVPSDASPDDRFNSIRVLDIDGNNKFDTTFFTCPGGTPLERLRIESTGDIIFKNNGGDNRIERDTTSGGPYLLFHNRGTGTTDNSGVYNMGGISAAGYRDVANPSIVGSIQFERQPTAGGASSGCNIVFRTGFNGTTSHTHHSKKLELTYEGHLLPGANNQYDLGSTAKGWRNVYMNDLNLSNMKGDTNDVDGTQGSWTIQEGKDDLYIINRLNGKKFKIKMEEIS